MELKPETQVTVEFKGHSEPWTIAELLEQYPAFAFETLVEDIFDNLQDVESVEILGFHYLKN
jgi:hypothetical protein